MLSWLFKVIVTLWLFAMAYSDVRTAVIPNWLTLPAIALLGGWRAVWGLLYALKAVAARLGVSSVGWIQRAIANQQAWSALQFMLLAWIACFALWALHVIGGGDAKMLMGLFALFPSVDFVVFLTVAVLLLGLPLLLLKLRGRQLWDILAAMGRRLREGRFFPSQRQLEEEGRPYAWIFCLPGVAYLWLLW